MGETIGDGSDRCRRVALSQRTPHVGIIGAGMTGLRCAEILSQKGMQVTILEGRNRVGGRVREVKSASKDFC